MAAPKRKVMVSVDADLVQWVEFCGSLSGQTGMSGYFNRAVRVDRDNAEPERLQAFELWKQLREEE